MGHWNNAAAHAVQLRTAQMRNAQRLVVGRMLGKPAPQRAIHQRPGLLGALARWLAWCGACMPKVLVYGATVAYAAAPGFGAVQGYGVGALYLGAGLGLTLLAWLIRTSRH